MIRTITLLECDGCGETLIGCQNGHTSREANTVTIALKHQWVRVHEKDGIKDYCQKCRVAYAK